MGKIGKLVQKIGLKNKILKKKTVNNNKNKVYNNNNNNWNKMKRKKLNNNNFYNNKIKMFKIILYKIIIAFKINNKTIIQTLLKMKNKKNN